jgi:hypothetical protein
MKAKKMSFQNIKDVLSRDEMKEIMAGSGYPCRHCCQGNLILYCANWVSSCCYVGPDGWIICC